MNNRHRLVKKLKKKRQFMDGVKKLMIYVPSPAIGVIAGTHVVSQKIFMSTYIAVQNAMKKLDQRIMKEFSEE